MTKQKLSQQQRETIFVLLLFVIPFLSPGLALLLGLVVALSIGNPFIQHNKVFTKMLLQASVVGLGFGMNVEQAISAGKTGILFTIFSIAITMILGLLFGKLLKINKDTTILVAGGTAICGGSAIAALGPVIDAKNRDMTVALGTIFMLNAAALFLFPPIGDWLHMSDTQFGYWCAIAIHDTSSVVGAAATRSEIALHIATTTKLIRALWIIPLSLIVAFFYNRGHEKKSKITIPWFIFLYVVAMLIATYFPEGQAVYTKAVSIAKMGMIYTLFLIGTGLSKENIKEVGFSPILLGIILWFIISILSAIVILLL
ncbi:MAG TPA: putative sulfate exporter family transporter [Paludibacteraceae bacterium]|nr:putative sulfate exporter family transporter [Paludibacteraceae bacterium]HQB68727.1 putative sulfate exporter family transporter [Paludibacteraceae bacterium]HRS67278.1 putative sulfate exporter family transporter [Paludibacteraceae bacterium]